MHAVEGFPTRSRREKETRWKAQERGLGGVKTRFPYYLWRSREEGETAVGGYDCLLLATTFEGWGKKRDMKETCGRLTKGVSMSKSNLVLQGRRSISTPGDAQETSGRKGGENPL